MPFFNQTKHFILSQTPEITGRFTQTSKKLKKTTKLFSTIEEINKQLPKKGGATLIVDFTTADGDLFEQFLNFFNQNEEKIQTCIFLLSDEHAENSHSFFDKVLNSGSFDLVFNADQLNANDSGILVHDPSVQKVIFHSRAVLDAGGAILGYDTNDDGNVDTVDVTNSWIVDVATGNTFSAVSSPIITNYGTPSTKEVPSRTVSSTDNDQVIKVAYPYTKIVLPSTGGHGLKIILFVSGSLIILSLSLKLGK